MVQHRLSPVIITVIFISFLSPLSGQLIHIGHAHNDYEHDRPLINAWLLGYTSIEVDIHPVKKELKVSHNRIGCRKKPNIEVLYFHPLDSIARVYDGLMYDSDSTQLTLMVDLKTKKKKALKLLDKLLRKYDHLLEKQIGQDKKWGPIRILISGNPPIRKWKVINSPYLFLDGRANKSYPNDVAARIKRISGHINTISSIKELRNNRSVELAKLKSYVSMLYDRGVEEVRFWGAGNSEDIWQILIESGVNKISVDDLEGFASWYKKRS